MRILVLGGTAFVGRAIVEDALSMGAEVTLFGRGKTGTELFPGVPRLRGDRDTSRRPEAQPPAISASFSGLHRLRCAHGARPLHLSRPCN